ncbi:MAG: hypothetical protein Q8Q67_01400 [bacterium]|nr:hypothetical protein [bacterium]
MKKLILAILMALIVAPAITSAQGRVKNPSNVNTMELSQRGNRVMLVRPGKEAVVWFLPEFGETSEKVLVRFFNNGRVVNSFATHLTIPRNGACLVSERGIEVRQHTEPRKTQPARQQQTPGTTAQKQQVAVTPGFQPAIPQVTAAVTPATFPLVLVDSTDYKILVFEGDFYGAALAPGQRTEASMTKPGMIGFKILYDADPPESSTGKNIWQVSVSGIVTQDDGVFVLRNSHLNNIQRAPTKVVFKNNSPYTMVCDDPGLDIEPIAPGRYSKKIRMATGFNRVTFSYIVESGVKVTAVSELAISRQSTVIMLNANPLGASYGVIQPARR